MGDRSVEERLSGVLDALSEAPFSNAGWELALSATADFIGADCVDLSFIDPLHSQFSRVETARIDLPVVQRYMRDFMGDPTNDNPRVPFCLNLSEGEYFRDSQVWNAKKRNTLPFFSELMHPLGLRDALMGMARKNDLGPSWLLLAGHYKKVEDIDSDVQRRFELLLPHFRRTAAVEQRLQVALRVNEALHEAFDKIDDALCFVDSSGFVKHLNAAALAIIRSPAGSCLLAGNRIALTDPAAKSAFAGALSRCATFSSLVLVGNSAPIPQIVVRRVDFPPLVLTLHPLTHEHRSALGAVAILFINDHSAKLSDKTATLKLTYGLTPTEARLMQALGNGLSLKEIAESTNVTYETIRSCLRQVLEKTGARRQSDLVRIAHKIR